MPWENIGSVNTGDMPDEETWILWSLRLARKYIELVCGEPPPGCKLDVMCHEHELGNYPSLGVWFDFDPPWDYINRCEQALEVFDEAISWVDLKEHLEQEAFVDEDQDVDAFDQDEDET